MKDSIEVPTKVICEKTGIPPTSLPYWARKVGIRPIGSTVENGRNVNYWPDRELLARLKKVSHPSSWKLPFRAMLWAAAKRFWPRVHKTDTCWTWTGPRGKGGYGVFLFGRERVFAHRMAWQLANKKTIPAGMMACHHCDNPPCVRPSHLFLGTAKDNAQDAKRKGRLAHQKRKGFI